MIRLQNKTCYTNVLDYNSDVAYTPQQNDVCRDIANHPPNTRREMALLTLYCWLLISTLTWQV